MSEHLYPCRSRTDPLAICDCKTNHMTPTASDECRKLLPCPFCGGTGEVFREDDLDSEAGWQAHCDACWLTMGNFPTEIDAVAAWNRRAPALAQAEVEVVASAKDECFMCHGKGWYWMPWADVAGVKPPTKQRVNCAQCAGRKAIEPSPQQGKNEHGEAVDSIVESVRAKLLQRSQTGIAKYGVSLDRSDLTRKQWLTHLQEELLDAANYAEREIQNCDAAPQPTAEGSCLRRAIQDWLRGADIADETHWVTALDFIERRAKELAECDRSFAAMTLRAAASIATQEELAEGLEVTGYANSASVKVSGLQPSTKPGTMHLICDEQDKDSSI